jgi:protein SMG9
MSSSVLFQQLVKERFVLSDVRLDNSVEIQSLQVAAFILSVCHVVVVVMDSVDKLLFRFLQAAEMLRPTGLSLTATAGQRQTGSQPLDVQDEFVPHMVYVYNKASGEEFQRDRLTLLYQLVHKEATHLMKVSSTSGASLLASGILPFSADDIQVTSPDLNLFVFPKSSQPEKEMENGGV